MSSGELNIRFSWLLYIFIESINNKRKLLLFSVRVCTKTAYLAFVSIIIEESVPYFHKGLKYHIT